MSTSLNLDWDRYSYPEYISPIPQHLAKTNTPPPPDQVPFLRQLLVTLETGISRLDYETRYLTMCLCSQELGQIFEGKKPGSKRDQEIDRLKVIIPAAEARQRQMEQTLQDARCVLSPIRRLPSEVEGEILLYSLVHDFRDTQIRPVGLDVTAERWVLTHVYSAWRRELISRPSIWSQIVVGGVFGMPRCSDEILKEILARSRDHPLEIAVELWSIWNPDLTADVLALAASHSNRWKTAILYLDPQLFNTFAGMSQLPLPQLETLILSAKGVPDWNSREYLSAGIISCFSAAPKLRKLHLRRFKNIEKSNLPWANITHLAYSPVTLEDFLLLQRMPKLQFIGTCLHVWHQNNSVFPELTLPNVTSMLWRAEKQTFLNRLKLPSLAETNVPLALQFYDGGYGIDIPNQSEETVHTLLVTFSISSFYLHAMLCTNLTAITTLKLWCTPCSATAIAFAEKRLFPNLQVLILSELFLHGASPRSAAALFLQAVTTRLTAARGGSRIQEVLFFTIDEEYLPAYRLGPGLYRQYKLLEQQFGVRVRFQDEDLWLESLMGY